VLYFAILGAVKSLMFQVFSKHTNSHKLQKIELQQCLVGKLLLLFTVPNISHFLLTFKKKKKGGVGQI
jgi:hypothetical protein